MIKHLILLSLLINNLSESKTYNTHLHKTCVNLMSRDSILNKHICEEMGLSPCSSSSGVCIINPKVITEAPDREKCLKTLFGLFATISCNDSKPKEYIYSTEDGFTTVYLSKEVSKQLWNSCSRRAELSISDMLEEDESKRFCKKLTLNHSKVKIRRAVNLPGLSKIPLMRAEDIAEIDWLLGGPVNWNLIKLKISGVIVILIIILLSITTIYVRQGDIRRKLKRLELDSEDREEKENLIELELSY